MARAFWRKRTSLNERGQVWATPNQKYLEQFSLTTLKEIINLKPMSMSRKLSHRNWNIITACLSASRDTKLLEGGQISSYSRHCWLSDTHTLTSTIYIENRYFFRLHSVKL